MTADERETLEALAGSQESDARLYAGQPHRAAECRSRAAAIRAALAEVDRLRADLTGVLGEVQRIQPEGSPPPFGLPFHAKWCVDAMIALVDALTKRALDAEMGLSIFRDDCAAVSAALARLPLAPGATDAGIGWHYRISELIVEVDRLAAENTRLAGDLATLENVREHLAAADACQRRHDTLDAVETERDALKAENADLRARAIPESLIERYETEVECYRNKRLALRIDCRTREVVRWVDGSPDAQVTVHPTLAAALDAASTETT